MARFRTTTIARAAARAGCMAVWLGTWLVGAPGCAVDEPAGIPAPDASDAGSDPDIVEVAREPAPPPPPPYVSQGDLEAITAHGALRVLVYGEGEVVLPRDGASSLTDRELAAELADTLGVAVEPVSIDRYDDLVPALLAGRGDLIAARMTATPTREAQIAFSRPTAVVSELVIGRKGEAKPPAGPAELAGRTVTTRPSSAYRESLVAVAAGPGAGVVLADAPEDRDSETLVHDVSTGAIAYTVCDSDLFAHVAAYDDGAVALFPIATGRQIGWGIRKDNPALLAAANAFLVSRAMTGHRSERSTGDLEAIRARGALRVLTRNNATSYFLHQGTQRGFDFELAKRLADAIGVRLEIVVPPDADDLVPWLLDGRGDLIAAELTVTAERQKRVAFSKPYLLVDEVVVQRASDPPVATLAELRGKTIAVRRSSSYRSTLDALQATAGPFTIVDVPEDVETERIIDQVARGELPMTVADHTIANLERAYGRRVASGVAVGEQRPVAYAVRPNNPELLAAANAFVDAIYKTVTYNVIAKRYFEDPRTMEAGLTEDTRATGKISPYDDLLKRRSAQYGLDWRLMASQAYQESRFDPLAKSWVGALGLFQLMPATARELGFEDVNDPENGVHAGVMYMSRLIDRFEPTLPFKQRVRFALASYNVGKGHVDDARLLAGEMGLDRNKWFGNVEQAMLKLQDPKVARKARYGFCRGEEPVHYVSQIQSRYEAYLTALDGDTH